VHYFNHHIGLLRRNSSVNRDYDYDEKWNKPIRHVGFACALGRSIDLS